MDWPPCLRSGILATDTKNRGLLCSCSGPSLLRGGLAVAYGLLGQDGIRRVPGQELAHVLECDGAVIQFGCKFRCTRCSGNAVWNWLDIRLPRIGR